MGIQHVRTLIMIAALACCFARFFYAVRPGMFCYVVVFAHARKPFRYAARFAFMIGL